MEIVENCHAGHRDRMTDKFMSAPNAMQDHEILEMLLFYAIPRKDTNELAHNLIRVFGSLQNVLEKTPKELMMIDGIGKRTAVFLSLVNAVSKRKEESKKVSKQKISYLQYKNEFIDYYANNDAESETVFFVLLDKKFTEITRLSFSNNSSSRVYADSPELSKAIAVNKPAYLITVHNHPSGNINPSRNDDITTAKLYILCQVHGVTFADHIIIAEDDAFSYRQSLRLEYIKENADISKMIKD